MKSARTVSLSLDRHSHEQLSQYALMVGQSPEQVLSSAVNEYMDNYYEAVEKRFNKLNGKRSKKLSKQVRKSNATCISASPAFSFALIHEAAPVRPSGTR